MDDSQLIELVREHSGLYNPKHPEYKDLNIRENVWMEIAALLKQPVEDCKNRWKNIRDTYMRRKRNKKPLTGSSRAKKLRKWYLEKHLVFLNQVDCERETLTNIGRPESQNGNIHYESQSTEDVDEEKYLDDCQNDTAEIFNTNIMEASTHSATESVIEPTQVVLDRRKTTSKKASDTIAEILKKNADNTAALLSALVNKKQEHPIDVFFQSMAESVKKLSSERQIRAKMHICNFIGRLELEEIGCFDDVSV
ncbi:transcription factor Adf-1-like [Zophobas morio]|uniref:transcription factor Adf-1-like n=1 Tax=Zophobas morio TaxID=2755281 RepID=UPI003083C969